MDVFSIVPKIDHVGNALLALTIIFIFVLLIGSAYAAFSSIVLFSPLQDTSIKIPVIDKSVPKVKKATNGFTKRNVNTVGKRKF